MYKKLLLNTLIQQEKRAAILFTFLLMTVVLIIDIFIALVFTEGKGIVTLLGYSVFFLLLPVTAYFFKNNNPRYVKYIYFFSYVIVNFFVEIYLYWDSARYTGGNIAEVFFVLFSPIFVNRRYFLTVVGVTLGKYLLVCLILNTTGPLIAIALLTLLSLVAMIILFRFYGYISAVNDSYFKQFEGVVKGIISTLELKDPYTKGHSQRVAEYATILADSLKIYSSDDLKLIYQACLLHDVGKVHTPDQILTKSGKLSVEEYEIVKQHPVVGAQAIRDIPGLELCLDIVLYHHERWDGKGYPEGLKETQIPITARITAIADSFDAMTTKRSYRDAMTAEEAYKQILNGRGSQFDPALVEYFEMIFDKWKDIAKKNNPDNEALLTQIATTTN